MDGIVDGIGRVRDFFGNTVDLVAAMLFVVGLFAGTICGYV